MNKICLSLTTAVTIFIHTNHSIATCEFSSESKANLHQEIATSGQVLRDNILKEIEGPLGLASKALGSPDALSSDGAMVQTIYFFTALGDFSKSHAQLNKFINELKESEKDKTLMNFVTQLDIKIYRALPEFSYHGTKVFDPSRRVPLKIIESPTNIGFSQSDAIKPLKEFLNDPRLTAESIATNMGFGAEALEQSLAIFKNNSDSINYFSTAFPSSEGACYPIRVNTLEKWIEQWKDKAKKEMSELQMKDLILQIFNQTEAAVTAQYKQLINEGKLDKEIAELKLTREKAMQDPAQLNSFKTAVVKAIHDKLPPAVKSKFNEKAILQVLEDNYVL